MLDSLGLPSSEDFGAEPWWSVTVPAGEERYWVQRVRDEGLPAEVNAVLFLHSLTPDPFIASPFIASPFIASPFIASPFIASPFIASPFIVSPFIASPFIASDYGVPFAANPTYGNPIPVSAYATGGVRPSAARVAREPHWCQTLSESPARVVVIDTGMAGRDNFGNDFSNQLLSASPFNLPFGPDVPDVNGDGFLDPVAGHGTFIVGIVELLGRPAALDSRSPVPPFGYLSVETVTPILKGLAENPANPSTRPDNSNLIINMSFGSTLDSDMQCLAEFVAKVQVTGAVVVASAGNDASYRPVYPAALPDVVSVGGLGAYGPAGFTNYGNWVRACAPVVDVVNCFFNSFNGDMPQLDAMGDPDQFEGWAVWSGTSFAAPAVVAGVVSRDGRLRLQREGGGRACDRQSVATSCSGARHRDQSGTRPGRGLRRRFREGTSEESATEEGRSEEEGATEEGAAEEGAAEEGAAEEGAAGEEGPGEEGPGEEGPGEEGPGEEGPGEEGRDSAALIASQLPPKDRSEGVR